MSAQNQLSQNEDFGGIVIEPLEFQNFDPQQVDPQQELRNLSSQNRMLMQLCQALGDYNRYMASKALGYPASDNEAFIHYVLNGGKRKFDQDHPPKG